VSDSALSRMVDLPQLAITSHTCNSAERASVLTIVRRITTLLSFWLIRWLCNRAHLFSIISYT